MALLESENPFGNHHFQVPAVCFQGCKFHTLRKFRVQKKNATARTALSQVKRVCIKIDKFSGERMDILGCSL